MLGTFSSLKARLHIAIDIHCEHWHVNGYELFKICPLRSILPSKNFVSIFLDYNNSLSKPVLNINFNMKCGISSLEVPIGI